MSTTSAPTRRPTIELPGLITPHLTQGKKMTAIADDERARELWAEVAGQVEEQRLALGVYAKLPEKVGTVEMAPRAAGAFS